MDIKDLLDKKVSFQTTVWAPLSKEMTIHEVIDEIKSDKYLIQIERLRKFILNEQLDEYNIHKKNLPAVTFCGVFDGKRRKELLKVYNQVIVLDIDKLSPSDFKRVKQVLSEDDFVFASWESPSKKGLKGLVSHAYQFEVNASNIDNCHKVAFRKLQEYFLSTHNIELDESGSDTTRLCFLSYDNDITCKEVFKPFVIDEIEVEKTEEKKNATKTNTVKSASKKDALYNPLNRNNSFDRKTIQAIIKYLTKNNLSITYTYEDWYRVAIAIANSFTYEIGEKYFLSLSRIDKNKFNETDCKNMLIYSYENRKDEISFKSIEYLAAKKGYEKKSKRGSSEGANAQVSAL